MNDRVPASRFEPCPSRDSIRPFKAAATELVLTADSSFFGWIAGVAGRGPLVGRVDLVPPGRELLITESATLSASTSAASVGLDSRMPPECDSQAGHAPPHAHDAFR